LVYYPFPGYDNLTMDKSNNSGLPDEKTPKDDLIGFKVKDINYKEYTFTIDNLSPFRYYSIKLVGNSTNQAFPPRVKDLRVIALAGSN
jgi:hypothetical protein